MHLKLGLHSSPFDVRNSLCEVKNTWTSWGLDSDFCDVAELVLAEVLNNIVEHAYAGQDDGEIMVASNLSEDKLHVGVRDGGKPMPGGMLPAGELKPFGEDPDLLPEGGFGWFMIREIAQDLDYTRTEEWNLLSFSISRGD